MACLQQSVHAQRQLLDLDSEMVVPRMGPQEGRGPTLRPLQGLHVSLLFNNPNPNPNHWCAHFLLAGNHEANTLLSWHHSLLITLFPLMIIQIIDSPTIAEIT